MVDYQLVIYLVESRVYQYAVASVNILRMYRMPRYPSPATDLTGNLMALEPPSSKLSENQDSRIIETINHMLHRHQ